MEQITKRIEKYLKEQFPKKEIIQNKQKSLGVYELFGTMGIMIAVTEKDGKVYYQRLKQKGTIKSIK